MSSLPISSILAGMTFLGMVVQLGTSVAAFVLLPPPFRQFKVVMDCGPDSLVLKSLGPVDSCTPACCPC